MQPVCYMFENFYFYFAIDVVIRNSYNSKSTAVQEELRNYRISLLKRNDTRWNSILFMIRSVLKLSPDEIKSLVGLLPKTKERPKISAYEREQLVELKDVLELFEQFTNNMQSDSITISKVYPAVSGLKVSCLRLSF